MSASPPPSAESPQRKWLPLVIGIALLVILFSWMRSCGKAPETAVTPDTTQTMVEPAPAVVDTPAAAEPAPAKTSTGAAPSPARRADTVVPAAEPQAAPAPDPGVGAMGGRGRSGKEAPTAPAPPPQAQQKPK